MLAAIPGRRKFSALITSPTALEANIAKLDLEEITFRSLRILVHPYQTIFRSPSHPLAPLASVLTAWVTVLNCSLFLPKPLEPGIS